MTRSIQALAAQAGREARANGLPCGDYVYTNRCEDQQAYRSIEAMRSPEQLAEIAAKKEAEKAARMLEAKTLTKDELDLAIKVIEAARQDSLWNTNNDIHWELIPILSKLRRMQND
jgi:hypothetical protein